jgi:hypothetical protein
VAGSYYAFVHLNNPFEDMVPKGEGQISSKFLGNNWFRIALSGANNASGNTKLLVQLYPRHGAPQDTGSCYIANAVLDPWGLRHSPPALATSNALTPQSLSDRNSRDGAGLIVSTRIGRSGAELRPIEKYRVPLELVTAIGVAAIDIDHAAAVIKETVPNTA